MKFIKKIWNFFKEAKMEFQKVKWPSSKETVQYTLVVIGLSLLVAAFLGGLDFLFIYLLNRFIF